MKNTPKKPKNPLIDPAIIALLSDCEYAFHQLRITQDSRYLTDILLSLNELRQLGSDIQKWNAEGGKR